jgi:hypothetical protein
MINRNGFLILLFITFLFSCRFETLPPYEEELKLYNEALDQIITENFKSHCLLKTDSAFIEKTNEAFYSRKIDSDKYYRTGDSLFARRKIQLPKCIMEYSPLFEASLPIWRETCRSSMKEVLQDNFFKDYFSSVSADSVIDTLLQSTTFNWEAISLPYMEFVPHDTSDQMHRYGNAGAGVIALSKIYFNQKADHAIIFFEFRSGPNFQRGEVVFLEKKGGHWMVVGFHTVWIT